MPRVPGAIEPTCEDAQTFMTEAAESTGMELGRRGNKWSTSGGLMPASKKNRKRLMLLTNEGGVDAVKGIGLDTSHEPFSREVALVRLSICV